MKNMLNDAKQYRQYLLRIDKNVFEEVKSQAEKDRRGISREIEFMLDWYLKNLKRSVEPC
ncbi:MAG: hypothetical protein LBR79_00430 [Oscillospiraceae bacterium]|jgi:hypothetical protein|nr:hypothetical protein [Oscillospiraceae bacterium]